VRTLKLTAVLSGFLLILFLHANAHALEPPQGIIRQDGHPAPALKLMDMDGNSTDLKQLRGKWVFVHFWASWCGPCRRELPRLQVLPERLDPERFAMLLINTAEDEDTVFTFLAAVAPELNTLLDKDGLATEAWQPRGLPATYLVDPAGRVQYQALGGRPWDDKAYLDFLTALLRGKD
jgi:thiol-disulfide isomerase/thioredoxin